MAVALKDLIDINLLDYYDEKIKDWVATTIEEKTNGLELTTRDELPETGETGKIYIVEDAILYWDDESQDYVAVGSSEAAATSWTEF